MIWPLGDVVPARLRVTGSEWQRVTRMNDNKMNGLVLRCCLPNIISINPENADFASVVSCNNVPSGLVSVVLSQNQK
jgi:hypothetical protein